MKRSALIVAVSAVLVAAPAAAQWTGMPVWNDPKGGTGITISGDYGKPNDNYRGGNAWGGRGSCRSDRKSTRLNSSHANISYAVFCLKKKKKNINTVIGAYQLV